jgi:uracil-DNA glycosylase family 4
MTTQENLFVSLTQRVQSCQKCARMEGSARVLSSGCGSLRAKLIFVGEAPGRLGADGSHLPFHGDKSGHNFELLIEQVGISRYDVFVTNAVLCNPKDADGNNSTPTSKEIENCSSFLAEQLSIIDPKVVVTLGAVALKACDLVEPHGLRLSTSVRTNHKWLNRALIPCYHPGQRAMIHRSFANQLSDYQFIAETLRRNGKARKPSARNRPGNEAQKMAHAARFIISEVNDGVTYFALHKLLFLSEVAHLEEHGTRLTSGYVIRQKDGPYYVDLHPTKLATLVPGLMSAAGNGVLRISPQLHLDALSTSLSASEIATLRLVVSKYGMFNNVELKRRTYLTSHMRILLRKEKILRMNMFNAPLLALE